MLFTHSEPHANDLANLATDILKIPFLCNHNVYIPCHSKRKSLSVIATTLVALRNTSSSMFSSACLAFDSGIVRGPAPYRTTGIPYSLYRRASVYSGDPVNGISTQNISWAFF